MCVPDIGQTHHQVVERRAGQQSLQDRVHKTPIRPEKKEGFSHESKRNHRVVLQTILMEIGSTQAMGTVLSSALILAPETVDRYLGKVPTC